MNTPIRVLVVEDSATIRKHIVQVLARTPDVEVVGEAPDGKVAIELCERLRPNVVTMDMVLPEMTGVAATEHIMAYCPTPILIVSASTNRGELFQTYDALAAGAVDVLDKPVGDEFDEDWERRLISAVRMVCRIRVISHPRARLGRMGQAHRPSQPVDEHPQRSKCELIAIGASTGGPNALLQVLSALPVGFPVPILIVLHIAEPFGRAMAQWLDAQVSLEVSYALDGERLPAHGSGRVLMAPPNQHLELCGERLRLTDAPERHSCRPSVDVLFESIARMKRRAAVGCLLTGMGKDGARGLLAMRHAGASTLAQNEASSIVFGMPAEAIKLGAADCVLPLSEIAAKLAHIVESGMEGTVPR